MVAMYNALIVKADGIFRCFEELGGLKLWVDPLFKPGTRKVIHGVVMGLPETMAFNIAPDVQLGDKVYFHYNALAEKNAVPDHEGLFFVDYDMVFCAVRGETIVPIGGRVFLEPIFDDDVVDIEIEGRTVKGKMSRSGIVTEVNSGPSLKKAILRHIGSPVPGAPTLDVAPGDTVFYIRNGDFRNTIEGVEYFVMYQEDLLMKL